MPTTERRYFAYGSNMVRSQMARRCPAAREIGRATLPGWRFAIGRQGYATLVPDRAATAAGLLWSVTPRCEQALDDYEAVSSGLYRKQILEIGGAPTLVYLAADAAPGRPRAGYVEAIIAAARELGFPADYIEQCLRPWLEARPIATPDAPAAGRARRANTRPN